MCTCSWFYLRNNPFGWQPVNIEYYLYSMYNVYSIQYAYIYWVFIQQPFESCDVKRFWNIDHVIISIRKMHEHSCIFSRVVFGRDFLDQLVLWFYQKLLSYCISCNPFIVVKHMIFSRLLDIFSVEINLWRT